MPEDSKLPYVYILGMEHSGSTLLAFLLNAHPQMATIGEVDVAHDILPARWEQRRGRCSCGKRYFNCKFWQAVLAGMAVSGSGLGKPGLFDYQPLDMETAQKKLFDFSAAVLDVSDTAVFVDASKKSEYIQPLRENPFIDLRVLNIYRDGRGVVNSWRKNNPNESVPNLIRKWLKQEKKRTEALKNFSRRNIFSFKYENLCLQPGKMLPKIFSFIGVQPDVDVTQGYKSEVEHHIVGNPMRLSTNEIILLDEKWRRELSEDDLRAFKRLRGNIQNRKNGYWR